MTAPNKTTVWVGLGASAGGLEALRVLVKHLPEEANAIYVVAQHLSPHHESSLAALISHETDLAVHEIVDNAPLSINTIYVTPPNCDVSVRNGRLRLDPPASETGLPKPSVNRFFRSMAENLASRAIGVVLSGTGSDGAYGIQALRAAGGVTIAQAPSDATYSGMPQAAIDTDCVDAVLMAKDIGNRALGMISLPRTQSAKPLDDDELRDGYTKLLEMIQLETNVDFRGYKIATIRRRIDRRVAALELGGFEAYLDYIAERPEEIMAVFRDMMISVTSFFRDPEEFEGLERQLQDIVNRRSDRGLRIWVPGCASGEEVYSIAITLVELMGGIASLEEQPLQIFATDIDADALARARRGFYADAVMDNVPPDLRNAYFTRSGAGYQINSAIRDCVVFTQHNLCQDPPFSNLDVVSCRNVLIYFNSDLQTKVLGRLHYGLRPNGLLMLGKPEWTTSCEELFRQIEPENKIFRRRAHVARKTNPSALRIPEPFAISNDSLQQEKRNTSAAHGLFDSLVRSIGPNGLLVNSAYQIKKIYGSVDRFVSLSEGDVRGVTVDVLHTQLRQEVRTLISLALKGKQRRSGTERMLSPDDPMRVKVEVYPVSAPDTSDGVAVVIFNETPVETVVEDESVEGSPNRMAVASLERELSSARHSLQQTVEELETTNEELQSLNEELQSGNEELQSTNEELETANEELQSTNEELITVNEELQINSHELSVINQELDSILSNIAAPILVVDAALHIVRCSEAARSMFRLDAAAARPHLSQCKCPDGLPALVEIVSDVLRFGKKTERAYKTTTGAGRMVAAPYFSSKGELVGATAIFSDISQASVNHDAGALMEGLPVMIWQKDENDKLLALNSAASAALGVRSSEVIGYSMADIAPGLCHKNGALDAEVIRTMESRIGLHEKINMPDGQTLWLNTSRIPFELADGQRGVYVVAQDISDRYQPHIDRRQTASLFEQIVDNVPVAIEYVDAAGQLQYQNSHARQLDGLKPVGQDWRAGPEMAVMLYPGDDAPADQAEHPILRCLRDEIANSEMATRLERDGTQSPQWTHAVPVNDHDGNIAGAIGVAVALHGHFLMDAKTIAAATDTVQSKLYVVDWNIQSDTIVLSPPLHELLGLTSGDDPMRLDLLRGLIDPVDVERFNDTVEAHLTHRVPLRCAIRVQPKRHEGQRWLSIQGQAVWDDTDQPAHLLMTLTDVTETWLEARAQERSSALASMAEETGALSFWTLDFATDTIQLSSTAADVLGIDPSPTLSLDDFLDAIHRDDRADIRHGVQSVADEALPFTTTVKLADKSASALKFRISGRPERDPGGTVTGTVGLVQTQLIEHLLAVGE